LPVSTSRTLDPDMQLLTFRVTIGMDPHPAAALAAAAS
jgi:hypothetical protein